MEMPITWKCNKCDAVYDPPATHVEKSVHRCKPCLALEQKTYRAKQKAAGIKIVRKTPQIKTDKYNPNRKYHLSEQRKAYEASPERRQKQKTRSLLRAAVARGEIQKLPCNVCGNTNSQAHHEDYSKPYDVIWFCHQHHIENHKQTQTGVFANRREA